MNSQLPCQQYVISNSKSPRAFRVKANSYFEAHDLAVKVFDIAGWKREPEILRPEEISDTTRELLEDGDTLLKEHKGNHVFNKPRIEWVLTGAATGRPWEPSRIEKRETPVPRPIK